MSGRKNGKILGQVFLLHGMHSTHYHMEPMKEGLEQRFASRNMDVPVACVSYDWKDELVECAELAKHQIVGACGSKVPVVLVGHSQGGLVSRLLALMLAENVENSIYALPKHDNAYQVVEGVTRARSEGNLRNIKGICTVGTPNTGALTNGQMNVQAKMLASVFRQASWFLGRKNYTDLSTDRVFRALQCFGTSNVRYLSMSGSVVNRFSAIDHSWIEGVQSLLGVGTNVSLSLEKPNDGVVVESSADLTGGPLPIEVTDRTSIEHFRRYPDCTKVNHVSIKESPPVLNEIVRWTGDLFASVSS